MKQIPIIIDTDPGIDDFFCLTYACAFPEVFDLRAVTTVGGNHHLSTTTRNALAILHFLHRDDIEVAPGAQQYLLKPFGEPVTEFHGKNGIGEVQIEDSPKQPLKMKAWDRIYKEAVSLGKELVLVTVAPLTNIAIAFMKYPDLKDHLRKIVMMGGSTGHGNIGPYTEANMGHDSLASRIVFHSGVPIDMVGLNVTDRCRLTLAEFDDLSQNTDPKIATALHQLLAFRTDEAMHDIVAIASMNTDFITWKDAHVEIENSDEPTDGRCLIDYDAAPNARVAIERDRTGMLNFYENMLKRYPKR